MDQPGNMKFKNTRKQMKMKTQLPKLLRYSKSGSKREVYNNTGLPQEARKISNSLILHLKKLEEEEQMKEGNNKN